MKQSYLLHLLTYTLLFAIGLNALAIPGDGSDVTAEDSVITTGDSPVTTEDSPVTTEDSTVTAEDSLATADDSLVADVSLGDDAASGVPFYINNLYVVATNTAAERPAGAVSEISGQSSDCNKGFGGKFTWLVPTYTSDPNGALTGFIFVRQDNPVPGLGDLAEGAGGQFRYIIVQRELQNPAKVTKVALWRRSQGTSGVPAGYRAKTSDINEGRGGDYLYLVWN